MQLGDQCLHQESIDVIYQYTPKVGNVAETVFVKEPFAAR
jgi:hypothetical protein